MTDERSVLPCVGCGGLVPAVDGPSHPYMLASAGCWQLYDEIVLDASGLPGTDAFRWHHVDAYAVQHPGGAVEDRRQRQSVAVHLISLCLLLEHGQPARRASARRGRTSETVLGRVGLDDWPYLEPPDTAAPITAATVHAAQAPAQRTEVAAVWLSAAWSAWSHQHDVVREWADVAIRART